MARVIPDRRAAKYVVKNGDTLSSIAMRQTGSPDHTAIWEQNKDIIGDNPNNLTPGMILVIPGSTKDTNGEVDW